MKDRTILGSPNQRRANRISWERPVKIVSPQPASGETVNVSSVGVLVHLNELKSLRSGESVAIEIPRLDGKATVLRRGRVVRVEPLDTGMAVAIDLI